jgi:hypothetical protein
MTAQSEAQGPDDRSGDRLGMRLAYAFEPGTTATHLERAARRRPEVSLVEGPAGADQLLWVESGVEWLPPLDELAAQVSAAWLIDTHRGMGWRSRVAGAFDVAFVAQFDALERVRSRGVPCEWLPLAAPSEICGPGQELAQRPFDVAFVGQCPPRSLRAGVLEALRAGCSIAPVTGFLEPDQMMELYRSARIVVNVPWARDLNMRTFEAAGARALLVTGPARKVDAVLPPGSFVLVDSDDPARWAHAVGAALRDPEMQCRADAAHHHVLANHTYDHRLETVIEVLRRTPRRRLSRSARAAALASGYARWGRLDSVANLPLSTIQLGRSVAEAVAWKGLITANRQRSRVRALPALRAWPRLPRRDP